MSRIDAPIITKKEYRNDKFRWGNPTTWYSTRTHRNGTLTPVTIQIRGRKILVYADDVGHSLFKTMASVRFNETRGYEL